MKSKEAIIIENQAGIKAVLKDLKYIRETFDRELNYIKDAMDNQNANIEKINEKLDADYVKYLEFSPVRDIVYGTAKIVGVSFVTSLVLAAGAVVYFINFKQ